MKQSTSWLLPRAVIVNADDFGQSAGINFGIAEAHEEGVVTSASLMVRWEAAADAADFARRHPRLSVGLHVDLCEWVCHDGEWTALYRRTDLDDPQAVETEILAQLAEYRRLTGQWPTHLDSHQHVHDAGPARVVLSELARELGVPLRQCSRVRYEGRFYGQTNTGAPLGGAVSVERLCELLRSLPPGVTELACHPGYATNVDTMYRLERELELRALCDPLARETLASEGIVLLSFADLSAVSSWNGMDPASDESRVVDA